MNESELKEIEKEIQGLCGRITGLKKEIGKVFLGNTEIVDRLVLALLSGGHVLLEGAPGLGKTVLVKALAQSLNLKFTRIQFTPDLMPADIIGTNIIVEEPGHRGFRFQKGPIFGNIVLADEINRATPKTQSALLEAMQECSVTVAGTRYPLEEPFMVIATQNPIEMEGTYPLPEAQLDRFFFKLNIHTPELANMVQILDETTGPSQAQIQPSLQAREILRFRQLLREVPVAEYLKKFVASLILATSPSSSLAPETTKKYVRYGASPRGGQAILLAAKALALLQGRYHVAKQDLISVATSALRHRLILNFEGEAQGVNPDSLIEEAISYADKNS